MTRIAIISLASIFAIGAALAQEKSETVEKLASKEETQKVMETLAQIGCQAQQVEKESDNLYEIDDAECKFGQYDIKLNSKFQITSMTLDE